jgi:hypothetical protein
MPAWVFQRYYFQNFVYQTSPMWNLQLFPLTLQPLDNDVNRKFKLLLQKLYRNRTKPQTLNDSRVLLLDIARNALYDSFNPDTVKEVVRIRVSRTSMPTPCPSNSQVNFRLQKSSILHRVLRVGILDTDLIFCNLLNRPLRPLLALNFKFPSIISQGKLSQNRTFHQRFSP